MFVRLSKWNQKETKENLLEKNKMKKRKRRKNDEKKKKEDEEGEEEDEKGKRERVRTVFEIDVSTLMFESSIL